MGTARRALVVALALAAAGCSYTPATLDVSDPDLAQSTQVLAADGTLLTTLVSDENRENVRLGDLPGHVVDAVLAVEDSRFYDHAGVDVRAVLRATRTNARRGEVVEGGSTITQQYVKNALLSPEQSLDRKLEEALLAVQLERRYSKDRILELYLNTIFFGNGAYGIDAAAREYFGVDAAALSVAQAATLAGLIRSPSASDPYDAPVTALARRDRALVRMGELGWLAPGEVAAAADEPLGLVERAPEDRYPAALVVEQAKRFVLDDPRFGATAAERRDLLFNGGLRITTTVDLGLQRLAEEAVAAVRPPEPGPEAALVSLEPGTGLVRAVVGGRDFFGAGGQAKVDLATGGAGRPAGSAFKPLVLAAALEEGIPLDRRFPAPARIEIPLPDEVWEVENYEGGGDLGEADLVEATVRSSNTVYAQLIQVVGPEDAVAAASRYGIGSPLRPFPSAVLGTNLVTGLDMASAYATFANRGVRVPPTFVTKVARVDGTILFTHRHRQERVVPTGVADRVNDVLRQVVERGTGTAARLDRPVAGKTGTGQAWRDAWFVGYTPELSTAVWFGFAEEGRRSMVPPATAIRVTGGSWPAAVWQRYATAALAGRPVTPFAAPGPQGTVAAPGIDGAPTAGDRVPRVRDVAGGPVGPAEAALAADGFATVRVDVPSDTAPAGWVVSQRPPAGSRLAPGGTVTLEVADGRPATVEVPSLLGATVQEARALLEAAGLGADVVVERPAGGGSPTGPGRVWKQSPAGGSRRPIGDTVRLTVTPGA